MDILRDAIVATLKAKFPEMEASIIPYVGLLDEQSDHQVSYPAPGMLVAILPVQEAPEEIAPFELRGNFGIVIAVKAARAIDRDTQGWRLAIRCAQVVYRNTWGISQMHIRPAIITGITKNEQRAPDGTPTGINYWTVQFYNWMKFEAVL